MLSSSWPAFGGVGFSCGRLVDNSGFGLGVGDVGVTGAVSTGVAAKASGSIICSFSPSCVLV